MIRILVAVLLVAISHVAVAGGKSDAKTLQMINEELQAQTEILTQIEENTASQGNGAAVVPLRALWYFGEPASCNRFVFLDTAKHVFVQGTVVKTDPTGSTANYTRSFSTEVEAEDWLIQLFIRVNNLDATLDDVPLDGTGQRDCFAWNYQLVTQ